MSSQKQKIRNETRITSHFSIDNKKFRLCYTPKGGLHAVAIQLNYHIVGTEPYIKRIIKMNKYRVIRVYLHKQHMASSKPFIPGFIEAIYVPGYVYRVAASTTRISMSQELGEYTQICTVQKEGGDV